MRPLVAVALLAVGCTFSGAVIDGPLDAAADAEIDAAPGQSWFDRSYRARRVIRVDNRNRPGLQGFPLALRFAPEPEMGDFGNRLRFRNASDTEDLAHEVEAFGAEALVWVRLDLTPNFESQFTMYYDREEFDPDASSDGAITFGGYDGVYHFADSFEPGSPSLDPVSDSTGTANLDVVENLSSDGNVVAGVLSSALGLEPSGANQHLETLGVVPEFVAEPGAVTTYEAWFSAATITTNPRTIFDSFDASTCSGIQLFLIFNPGGANGHLRGFFGTGDVADCTAGLPSITSSTSLDDGQWHHVVAEVNRVVGNFRLVIDGGLGSNVLPISTTTPSLGRALRVGDSAGFAGDNFDGRLDEVRIGGTRPPGWYAAQQRNTLSPSDMITIGDRETLE